MSVSVWQELEPYCAQYAGVKTVVFVIDASHQLEAQLLNNWIDQKESEDSPKVERVTVSLDQDLDDIPLDEIDHILQSVDADATTTLVAPLRVVWKTHLDQMQNKPRLKDLIFGNPRRPRIRAAKKRYAADPNSAALVLGMPAMLSDLKNDFDHRQQFAEVDRSLSHFVINQASLALDVTERRQRGSRYKVPRQVAKHIRVSERYRRGLQKIEKETGETQQQLRERALPIFKELVATPHNFWQDVMAVFYRWVMSLAYEPDFAIDKERLLRFRQIVQEHPSAILWTHKTHMDGLAIQSMLYENDFPTPHTMGGINMAFGGLGALARRAGAIFIRRSFQDNPLYKLVLHNYLSYLLEKRFPLTWSFEGTRSRVGKLMPPRYGMLKYVMEAMAESNADNLHIIPVAINYDMINDVKDYVSEQSGAMKRPESLQWLISYLRRMRHPLGRIYINFGEPVVVPRDSINTESLPLAKTAFQVGVETNRVTPITLTALMSMSLLGAAPRAQTISEMRRGMADLRSWASHRNVQFTSDFDRDQRQRVTEIIESMINIKMLTVYDEGPETVYAVAEKKHAVASYYRNSIAHHFVTKSIAELALVHVSTESENPLETFWQEAERLKDLFKFEFFYAPTEEFKKDVIDELDFFAADWQTQLADDFNYAQVLLKKFVPLVAHATLRPYVEAYRVMIDVFARLEGQQTLDEKSAVQAAFKYGKQAYLQRRISSMASIGELLFKNGYKVLNNYDLVAAGDDEMRSRRKQFSKSLRVLSHRLEHIAILARPQGY